MAAFTTIRRVVVPCLLALGCAAIFVSCASSPTPARSRTAYRLVWTATRTSDHVLLISTSMVVAVGTSSTIHSDSIHPTEDRPAFPRFTARLSTTKTPGVLQLVTRADLREAARNKKGKLKITKRNIGALLPIRAGETQLASLPADTVHLEVHLEHE